MVMGLIAAALFFPSFLPSDQIDEVPYDRFLDQVAVGEVAEILVDNQTGRIEFIDAEGTSYATTGPLELSIDDRRLCLLYTSPSPRDS